MVENEQVESKLSDDVEKSLYAKREKIYPREVHGLFAAFRASGVAILLGFYYIVPWLQWDERQAVCLNVSFMFLIWCSGRRISFISPYY